jgi:hypothetical protein
MPSTEAAAAAQFDSIEDTIAAFSMFRLVLSQCYQQFADCCQKMESSSSSSMTFLGRTKETS